MGHDVASFVLIFYWVVCGLAIFGRGKSHPNIFPTLIIFILCLAIGGFAVPALALQKALK